jgi:ribonuclease E
LDAGEAFEAEPSPAGPEFRTDAEPVVVQPGADVPAVEPHDAGRAPWQERPAAVSPEASIGAESSLAPPAPPPAPAAPSAAPERPRRRSTVREPVPMSLGESTGEVPVASQAPPMELPQPVISSTADHEDAERPRRSGWWSRRALGKG